MNRLPVVQDAKRSCHKCTACCTTHAVSSIDKAEFTRCEHQRSAGIGGCRIYKERPGQCREWACLWLMGVGDASDRPDKLGVVFDVQWSDPLGAYVLKVFQVRPNAHTSDRVQAIIRALLSAKGGVAILYRPGGTRTLLGGDPATTARAEAIMRAHGGV
ncbi:MAG: YkgJ family cysteine cluster protein [Acidimicrobiia bacterium]